jgi:hypothetical protein
MIEADMEMSFHIDKLHISFSKSTIKGVYYKLCPTSLGVYSLMFKSAVR